MEAFVWAWVHPGPCSNPSCLCKRWYARALIALGRPTCIHTSSHLLTPPSLFSSVFALSFSLTPTEWSEWCREGCLACQKCLFGFAGLYSLYAYFVLLLVFRCFVGCLCSVGFHVLPWTEPGFGLNSHILCLSFPYLWKVIWLGGNRPSENQPPLLYIKRLHFYCLIQCYHSTEMP